MSLSPLRQPNLVVLQQILDERDERLAEAALEVLGLLLHHSLYSGLLR